MQQRLPRKRPYVFLGNPLRPAAGGNQCENVTHRGGGFWTDLTSRHNAATESAVGRTSRCGLAGRAT